MMTLCSEKKVLYAEEGREGKRCPVGSEVSCR
jgi:hypothetical protein